ncbi:hypothetical protein SLA2020_313190 [Shorea laevis]
MPTMEWAMTIEKSMQDGRGEGPLEGLESFLVMEVVYGPCLTDTNVRLVFGLFSGGCNGGGVAGRGAAMMVGGCSYYARLGRPEACIERF